MSTPEGTKPTGDPPKDVPQQGDAPVPAPAQPVPVKPAPVVLDYRHDGWVAVAGYASLAEAYLGFIALESEGIACRLPEGTRPGGAALLQVRACDLNRATEVLKEAAPDMVQALEDIRRMARDSAEG